MKILGIDPGLALIGLGLIESTSPHDIAVIEWLTLRTASGLSLGERLREIHGDLSAYLAETKPALAVVEKLYFATNERTALDVAHARGAILLTLAAAAIPVVEPTPLQLKLAITGDGKADKRGMQMMLMRTLQLAEIPKPDDAADALALAVYGAISSVGLEASRRTVVPG